MTRKHIILFLFFLLFVGVVSVDGMPAYPKKIPVQIGNDIVYIRLFGDEHHKRAENLEGYTIIQKDGIWYFADVDSDNRLIPSIYRLSNKLEEDTKRFLSNIPKHLSPQKSQIMAESQQPYSRSLISHNVMGKRRILVILMQYSDLSLIKNYDDFDALFNGAGYSEDGAQGSVCDFYSDVSYGQLQLECNIVGPFTSKNRKAYYGANNLDGNDLHPEELFKEAVQKAAEFVSLKDYDSDGDGYVDNVHIIFAGYGEESGASSDAIWSHEQSFDQPYEIQGLKIDRYSCAPELRGRAGNGITRIGPHCHEIGHALGAMDYYDTNNDANGRFEGTGDWDVMASGSWNNEGITPADFNPYVKSIDFGWINPTELPVGNDVVIYPSCFSSNNYYVLKTSNTADYYLIENRSKEKWGYGVPGAGMLIYHIHSDISVSANRINCKAPQMCYVVCASSKTRKPDNSSTSYGNINTDGCPYPGSSNNTDFGQNSTPLAFWWDNMECEVELNNILMDNEGNIHLSNKTAISYDEDFDRRQIFFEGFEENSLYITMPQTEGGITSISWKVETDSEVPSKYAAKPLAYKGRRSLQLSAKKVDSKATSVFSFGIPEIIDKNFSSLKLSIYVNSFNLRTDASNEVLVGYRTEDNDEWQYSVIKSDEDNVWQRFVVDLPIDVLSPIRVDGIAYSGSILAVDNIEVDHIIQRSGTGVYHKLLSSGDNTLFYSLTGKKLQGMQKGICIVKDSNGNTRKIYVK